MRQPGFAAPRHASRRAAGGFLTRAAGAVLIALGLAAGVPAQAQDGAAPADPVPARRVILDDGWDRPGGDLAQFFNTTADACVQSCLADQRCVALTWNQQSRACFPKGAGAGAPQPFNGARAGVVVTPDAGLADSASRRAGEAADWLRADDIAAARKQARDLGADYPGTGESVDALRGHAIDAANADDGSAGDALAVARWIGATTAISDDASDWLSLAQWLAAAVDRDADDTRRSDATSAAVNSWLRDSATGTEALRLWADLVAKDGRGHDGLLALRMAAQTDDGAELAKQLATFEDRYGLRVDDTQVDADAAAPRACVVMTENLASGVDYRQFVALPATTLAVEAEGRQLCVTGVRHGEELKLTLRKGFPAASGEVLQRDIPVSLYVRDRTPQARFSGRAYILPVSGDRGLTVSTVNTDRVTLTLYSMSERNIVRSLRDSIFATPLSGWRADQFGSDLGEEIWHGDADVAALADGSPAPLNEEVSTRLDLLSATGPLSPGVYALTAAVPGQDEDRSPPTTQWFMVSDLGLASYSGTDGLTVVVRGISDAAARAGAEVALLSRGNAVLGRAQTDGEGVARFDAGLTRGRDSAAPAAIVASLGPEDAPTDMAFLSLMDAEFDLSDRGVEGAPPSPPIDVFATTDRGAYRVGETVHVTALIRDARAQALPDLPLTAVILRPDGVEAARMMPDEAGDGGFVFDWEVPDTAPRGGWRIDLRLERDGPPLASMRVLVEDFRPERIDLTPEVPDGPLRADAPIDIGLAARWLYGAPGADLPVEGELRLSAADGISRWAGYSFGREDRVPDAEVVPLPAGQTDAEGHWDGQLAWPESLATADRPMEARLSLAVREGAGRPVERSETRLVMPDAPVIGVKPGFDGSVSEGAEAGFEVIAIGPDLEAQDAEAEWVLNRVRTDYQWFALDGEWQWEPVTQRSRAASGTLAIGAGAPAGLNVPVEWGEYELVLRTDAGAETSLRFWAGWGAAGSGSDTPDRLRVTLDQPRYRAGETATATIEVAADGVATVSVLTNRVVAMEMVPVTAGTNKVQIPVTDDWGAGAYVTVSAVRPLDGDDEASHAPMRALGLAHAGVDPGAHRLGVTLSAPEEARPRSDATVRLAVDGAEGGETVFATIAAVDQGILNLTRFGTPDPEGHYFGQRRLGVALRDLYGRLILPSGARDGAIRTGGDAMSAASSAPPPTEKLMAWFSGPLTLGPDGTVEASVPLPDFNGEVRLMAVAWSAAGVGQADATLLVRDPVVMTVTAPAFLAPGDRAEAKVALTHVSGAAGNVTLAAESGDGPGLAGLPASLDVPEKARVETALTMTAPEEEGVAHLTLSAGLPDGSTVTKDLAIPVLRQDPAMTRAARVTLGPGQQAPLDPAATAGFRPGTATTSLTVGAFAQLDLGAAMMRLATYPYGCTEQLASVAMPRLYLGDLARDVAPAAPDAPAGRSMGEVIAQILTRQTSEGAFGLWDASGGDLWLDAFTTDFLARARAAGHEVPDGAFSRALANLQNRLNTAGEPQYADADDNAALAYAAYVLAREHAAVISDLRYYVDTAGDSFTTPMAAAQLGAALAAYADQPRADAMFARAQKLLAAPPEKDRGWRADYGTRLRDTAAALAVAAEAGSEVLDRSAAATQLAGLIADRQADGGALSTQEALWTVMAGHALQSGPDAGAGVSVDGTALDAPMISLGDPTRLAATTLANGGKAPVDVTLSTTGVPVDSPPAGANGWQITRRYFTPEGTPVDPSRVAQGTRLVAVLQVTPLTPGDGRLMITDPLPAGFEIDNPNLIEAGGTGGLDWIEDTAYPEMVEFRQDRFDAAVLWRNAEPFTLAYRLRAVTPGRFHHPAATVEDMYRPDRRGWTDSGNVEITR